MTNVHASSDDEPVEQKPTKTRRKKEIAYEDYRHGVRVGGRIVSVGSVGDDVQRLQRMINRRGAQLELDGQFGPKTESEVRKVQKALKIKSDGVVGPTTWSSLGW